MTAPRSAIRMLEIFARYRFLFKLLYTVGGALLGGGFCLLFGAMRSKWRPAFTCIECGKYPSLATFNYMVID